MLFFYGIWMLCHHGQSPKKGEKSKQRFLGYNEKTHFPFVKSARKPRNVSFLTQNPRFLRIVGYPAAVITANPDQSVNFFLHNPHDVYERFRRGALIYGPFGGPQGPPKKPVEKIFSKKCLQKGGQNNGKLPNLPRSKVLQTKFFF